MQTPLVSILIPLFNTEKYIEETIHCLLSQTYSNIEIIIVDDHSTDNSYQIVSQIESDKIKLVKNPKKGACSARNYAFSISNGEYIQYLDADDIMVSSKIENQLSLIQSFNNNTITFGDWARFYDTLENLIPAPSNLNKDYNQPLNWLIDCWNGKGMIPVHSWLTPSHLIKKAGQWNESLSHNQDGEFFSRVLIHADSLKFCSNSTVYYRSGIEGSISSGSKTKNQAASQLYSYQLYVSNLQRFIAQQELRTALAQNFLNFMYRFYNLYPDLVTTAEEEFKNLDIGKMWPVGGDKFKFLSNVIGFKNALKLRKKITL
jgi:glycosyltransferase involved in cell wall biosynthesis